jgi:hypothetical protein
LKGVKRGPNPFARIDHRALMIRSNTTESNMSRKQILAMLRRYELNQYRKGGK